VDVVGAELAGVLDQHQPLVGRNQRQQGVEQRGLAGAGATADQERQPSRDQRAEEAGAVLADGAGGHELVEGQHPLVGNPEGQHRAGAGERREHSMEARAVGEPDVDMRDGVVEPAATGRSQPLGESAHGGVVGERDVRALEPRAAVEVDLVGAVDQDIGDAGQPQQRLQRAGAEHVASQRLVDGQDRGIAHRTA
jgi:hypothetical protein